MCLGSSRNRRRSQANGRVPALSKTRLLDVWRFTVCSCWRGVKFGMHAVPVQHQRETDCRSHFSFRSCHPSQGPPGHGKKERIFFNLGLWASKLGTELPKLSSETRQRDRPSFCRREMLGEWGSYHIGGCY